MDDCFHLQPQNIGIRVTVDDRPDGDFAEYQAFYLNRQSLCRDSGGTPDTRDRNPSQAEQVFPLWRNARSNLTRKPWIFHINYCEASLHGNPSHRENPLQKMKPAKLLEGIISACAGLQLCS